MPHRGRDRRILQLLTGCGLTQKQSAAAHVAASDELFGKDEAFAEDLEQRLDVFLRRNAPEQYDRLARRRLKRDAPRITNEWREKLNARVRKIHASEREQVVSGHARVRRDEAAIGRDHVRRPRA